MAYTTLTSVWTGTTGLPGYTKLHFLGELDPTSIASAAGSIKAFWEAIKSYLPGAVTVQLDGIAQTFTTGGQLTGEIPYTPPAATVGTSASAYAGASGAVINWLTDQFPNGRRLRGRTFIVPMAGTAYQNDGTLAPTVVTALRSAAQALAGGPQPLCVVRRSGATALNIHVSGTAVPDRTAVLRSRRE